MDYEPLDIKDSDTETKGGPPGWMAFSIIFGTLMIIAVVAFFAGLFT